MQLLFSIYGSETKIQISIKRASQNEAQNRSRGGIKKILYMNNGKSADKETKCMCKDIIYWVEGKVYQISEKVKKLGDR